MTISQAVTQLDAQRHNGYTPEQKRQWLTWLDGKVHRLVFQTHEGAVPDFSGYDLTTPGDTQLLIGAPFEEIYLYWLEAQVCYLDEEMSDYNAAISQYNRLFGVFLADYTQKHMPLAFGKRFLF